MLGVATLIVVNSVMSGFSTKLKERLHGMLSDIELESLRFSGMADPNGKMAMIREDPYLNEQIEAMTPMMEIFGMVQYHCNRESVMRPVRVFGIDMKRRAERGDSKALR